MSYPVDQPMNPDEWMELPAPAPALSDAEAERVARFEAAPAAPESEDPALWATLSDLIPCNDFAGCADECECVEGELRLAVLRLIVAERVHHTDCGDDEDCCNATGHRARLVNKAAALTGDHLRARRTALRGEPQADDGTQGIWLR
jgi:hypothetical protein